MAETFTGSNGIKVEEHTYGKALIDEDGTNRLAGAYDFLNDHDMQALREFFRAEEDTRLGRWRWPEDPDVTVQPAHNADSVTVIGHREGVSYVGIRGYLRAYPNDEYYLVRAAKAYFDAHPEPKPWLTAADGEIWELDFGQGGVKQYLYSEGRFFALPLLRAADDGWTPAEFASGVISGHRVYPEDAS